MRGVPRSLRAQITTAVVILVTAVVALAGLVIVLRIDHRDRTDIDRQLATRAAKVHQDADKLLSQGDRAGTDNGSDDYGGLLAGSQSLVRIISDGRVVAQRGETPSAPLPVPVRDGYATVTVDGQTWRSLTQPLNATGDRLEVLQDIDPIQQRLADNTTLVAVVSLSAAILTGAGVWLITRLILLPLQRLRSGVLAIGSAAVGSDAVGSGTTGQQLPTVTRPREVADLSRALSGMLDQLHTSMEATRRFTADAGHELRTPLTTLGMTIETLQRNPGLPAGQRQQALETMAVEHQRITTLLTGLQALARGDAHALPEPAPVDLAELLADAVTQARLRHSATTYRLDLTEHATVRGWSAGLRLALDNLLDNAALHGRPDGTVHAHLAVQDGTARITVSDDGPGIAPDQRQAMKERFTRGPHARTPGSGLGLALVEQQAQLHHGTLRLATAVPDGGLQATLVLPVAGVAAA